MVENERGCLVTHARVQHWMTERMGLDAELLRGAGFSSFVKERMNSHALSSEDEYVRFLESSEEETEILAGATAVPETWFFRYPRSFELLVERLQALLGSGAQTVRIISAGCATGEEPYTLAMAAAHAGWSPDRVTIEAIDRSGVVLERARAAEYGLFSLRHEIPAWSITYLHRETGKLVVNASVRSMVRFRRADALEPGAFGSGGADFVFCRNVLIYLSSSARERLLRSIEDALTEGGTLFVGHAEQMLAVSPKMRRVEEPHAFALERVAAPSATTRTPNSGAVRAIAREAPPPATKTRAAVVTAPARGAIEVGATRKQPEPCLEDARSLADAGRIAESEAMVRTILARKGPSASALELLGTLRQAANDATGAKTLFEQALYLEPTRPTSLVQLAMIHEKIGDRAKAERMWERVRRSQPEPNEGGAP